MGKSTGKPNIGGMQKHLVQKSVLKKPAAGSSKDKQSVAHEPQAPTELAIVNVEEMTLDEKIQKMRDSQDPDCVTMTAQDWKKLNMRFSQTTLPKTTDDIKSLWGQVSQKGAREGKRNAQHTILKAWCVDPEFGETFATRTSSLGIKEGMKQEEEWVSRKKKGILRI